MLPGSLGLVAVEGIAFRSEVAEACLGVGVGVTRASCHREPCLPLLFTLTCIYVAQITCVAYAFYMYWGGMGAQDR